MRPGLRVLFEINWNTKKSDWDFQGSKFFNLLGFEQSWNSNQKKVHSSMMERIDIYVEVDKPYNPRNRSQKG